MLSESIIFDVDGTLWDSVSLVAKGWNVGLEKLGLEPVCTTEGIRPLFGKTMDQIAAMLLPEVPEEKRMDRMEYLMEWENRVLEEEPCEVFYPGVKETMEALAKNHRLFIVSNCQKGYIEICMEKGGFASWIVDHACFGDTGTPKGETILTLMKRNNVTGAVYVGDTQGDMEATHFAGLPFIWASYGFGQPEKWEHRITEFAQLLEL